MHIFIDFAKTVIASIKSSGSTESSVNKNKIIQKKALKMRLNWQQIKDSKYLKKWDSIILNWEIENG